MIYLDFAASTPLHDQIQSRITDYFTDYGNPQSLQMVALHKKIAASKQNIASYLSVDASRIFFTSGATESISTAIVGSTQLYHTSGNHIISFESEHPAVLESLATLRKSGCKVTILPINSNGSIDYTLLESNITSDTILVSLNHVCNETGLVQNLEPLIQLRKKYGFMIHLDACQSIGKTKLDLSKTPCDFVSLSAHKAYGPQGIGALYIASNRHVSPIIHGNHTVRSGTQSHALIQMMGDAYLIAARDLDLNLKTVSRIREQFLAKLLNTDVDFEINQINHMQCVPHILNICFSNASIATIEKIRTHIYCQVSSACHQGGLSHVLQARNLPIAKIKRSIRFSFGIQTTPDDIDTAIEIIRNAHISD